MTKVILSSVEKGLEKEFVISRAALKRLKSIKNKVIPMEIMKEIIGTREELDEIKKKDTCCVLM